MSMKDFNEEISDGTRGNEEFMRKQAAATEDVTKMTTKFAMIGVTGKASFIR
ncbi:MAG: hypothetical protein IJA10_08280 [Lachnospiraceae bacterium]|nr:hypothetical protein [Lachnospiraceae bacterium]